MDGLHVSPDMILPGVPVTTQLTPKLLQPEGFFLKRSLNWTHFLSFIQNDQHHIKSFATVGHSGLVLNTRHED